MFLPEERRQRILADIDHSGAGLVGKLSQKYGVSEMTIRRDLDALEELGYVKRTHGGAIRSVVPEPELTIVGRYKRLKLNTAQKVRIARYAAREYVAEGDVVLLEGGTTVATMVAYLAHVEELTLVTNGLATMVDAHRLLAPGTTILCAGGILRKEALTFVGPVTERFFREFHANKLFLSATGLTLEAGATDPSMLEAQVKQAMVSSASEVILLLDSSKFGVKSLATVLPLRGIDVLITDEGIPEVMLEGLRARGVDVRVVAES